MPLQLRQTSTGRREEQVLAQRQVREQGVVWKDITAAPRPGRERDLGLVVAENLAID
jgi:hypothetical protein